MEEDNIQFVAKIDELQQLQKLMSFFDTAGTSEDVDVIVINTDGVIDEEVTSLYHEL